jgi:hypothetical protein
VNSHITLLYNSYVLLPITTLPVAMAEYQLLAAALSIFRAGSFGR